MSQHRRSVTSGTQGTSLNLAPGACAPQGLLWGGGLLKGRSGVLQETLFQGGDGQGLEEEVALTPT